MPLNIEYITTIAVVLCAPIYIKCKDQELKKLEVQ